MFRVFYYGINFRFLVRTPGIETVVRAVDQGFAWARRRDEPHDQTLATGASACDPRFALESRTCGACRCRIPTVHIIILLYDIFKSRDNSIIYKS